MIVITVEAPARKRKYRTFTVRALLAATAVVALLVALWMALQPKRYVESFLQVKDTGWPMIPPAPLRSDPIEVRAFRAKQIELLHSDLVLKDALQQPDIASLSIVKDKSDPVTWLRANLHTDYVNESGILRVRLASSNPTEAVKLVDAVIDAYVDDCVNEDVRKRIRRRDDLQRLCDQRRQDFVQQRMEWNALKTTAAAGMVPGQKSKQSAEMDAELARREALDRRNIAQFDKAEMQLEAAKMEAKEPPRVVKGQEATLEK